MKTILFCSSRRQRGSVLLIMLAIVMAALMTILVSALPALNRTTNNTNANAQALAQAKAGLIAFAISAGSQKPCTPTTCERPGDLPCPDSTPDSPPEANGNQAASCGNGAGTTGQTARLGRLPWKTLNLPDLRDASGQRLWYAVSSNYKTNTRLPILNSDTGLGTITIRNAAGVVAFDGSNPGNIPSGVVAVIIAPGDPITRQDGHKQNRSVNAAQEYLDIVTLNGITEDNANFSDFSATDGFIQGPVQDTQGKVVSNDQIVFITYEEIMSAIEKRVAGDVMQTIASMQYPNPASFSDTTCLGTSAGAALTNFTCPSTSPSNLPWCNTQISANTPSRTLIINCGTTSPPVHPLCNNDPRLITNKSFIEVTCPAGLTQTPALAFRCSSSTDPTYGCGTKLNINTVASACTYTGPISFNIEICSGRTALAQTPPSNCGRVPPGIGLQQWGSTDLTRGGTGGINSWFQRNGWRELVFYALPGSCADQSGTTISGLTKLKITPQPPNSTPEHAIVVVAGRTLSPQQRTANNNNADKMNRNNYFESINGNTLAPPYMTFTVDKRSSKFNDTVVGQ